MNHLFIPDVQGNYRRSYRHLEWCGNLIRDKRPDRIIVAGDWADMTSISYWDRRTAKHIREGYTLRGDCEHSRTMLARLMRPWAGIKGYKPDLHILEGNHDGCEDCRGTRMYRYVQDNPELRGAFEPLECFREAGWQINHYQIPVKLDGVYYAHLFPITSTGNVTDRSSKWGATTSLAQIKNNMASCTAGHKLGFDFTVRPSGLTRLYGLIAGSFYLHDEGYKGPQGNGYWRGVVMKHEVKNGEYNLCQVSMSFLKKKYG